MLNLHTDNSVIRVMTMTDQSRLYIGLLWPYRRRDDAQRAIRGHIAMIRRWRSWQ